MDIESPSRSGDAICRPSSRQLHSSGAPCRGRKKVLLANNEVQARKASTVFMQLAAGDENKVALGEIGGLMRLVTLVRYPEIMVQLNVLAALANLALNDEHRKEMRKCGVEPQLILLLDSSNEHVHEKVLDVLWNLAASDENRVAIFHAGGVAKLLDMVPGPGCLHSCNPNLVARVLGALANLALHPENHAVIRDAQGVERIFSMLVAAHHLEMTERAAHCIEIFALDRESRHAIFHLGGVAVLASLLSSSCDIWIRAALGALKNLSVDDEVRHAFAEHGGITILIDMLGSCDRIIVSKSAECIGNLALEQEFCAEIKRLGGVPALVRLLEDGAQIEAQSAAAGAILNLSVRDECKLAIRRSRGIELLVPLLDSDLAFSLRSVTAMALSNISAEKEGALAISEAGGIVALLRCMSTPTCDALQEKAAGVLWNLSIIDSLQEVVQQAGAIPLLLSVSNCSSFVPTVENCLGVLAALSKARESRIYIAQSGVLDILIRLLSSDHDTIVEKAAGAIWNLSHEEAIQHSVRQLRGLNELFGLLMRNSFAIRLNALGAFCLLSEQDENVQEAIDLGIVPILAELLGKETHYILLQNAAHTLGNIANGKPHHQNVCGSHALRALVGTLSKWIAPEVEGAVPKDETDRANRQELLAKCCYAISSICHMNESNQIDFCKAGGLARLVPLLRPTNQEILLEMAAVAISAVCEDCEQRQYKFWEEGVVEPLVVLLDHTNDAVKLEVARALHHMSGREDYRRSIREFGGLDRSVRMLEDGTGPAERD